MEDKRIVQSELISPGVYRINFQDYTYLNVIKSLVPIWLDAGSLKYLQEVPTPEIKATNLGDEWVAVYPADSLEKVMLF